MQQGKLTSCPLVCIFLLSSTSVLRSPSQEDGAGIQRQVQRKEHGNMGCFRTSWTLTPLFI